MAVTKANLDVVSNQAKSDVELADLTLRFAVEDLEKYNDGEYPTKLNEAKGYLATLEAKFPDSGFRRAGFGANRDIRGEQAPEQILS
ncbi:MAG: hypothetical protein HGA54_04285 [Actinobacteria bacterium]|nr:hypothetical protein [Actinomycetota bacterium]